MSFEDKLRLMWLVFSSSIPNMWKTLSNSGPLPPGIHIIQIQAHVVVTRTGSIRA